MLLRVIQRLARVAPRPARAVWARVPKRVQRALLPLVYPVAVGVRGGASLLCVPEGLPARRYDIVLASDALLLRAGLKSRLSAEQQSGRRVVAVSSGRSPEAIARELAIADALYVRSLEDDAVRTASIARLGWRSVDAERLETDGGVAAAFPSVTVVVVTHASAALCAACLDSIRRNTPWPRLEVIVVDNGSRDGTRAMLEARAAEASEATCVVIVNDANRGFAPAANQGLARARGDIVVLLNDDTLVGPGWLSRLVAHLEAEPALGLVCPVTNEIGNAAKVPVSYDSFDGMERFAFERAALHAGRRRPIDTVALFCAAGRRAALESVGFLDERYAVGMFEDDDLSRALRLRGHELAVAEDAFVHHVGHASFAKLSDADYLAVWEANRRRFELKWGVRWHPPESSAGG